MSSSATGRAPTGDASPTKSDEYGELDFVVVDEVDNLPPPASPPAQGSSSEVTVDANSNVTAPRVYHRREKKALALSLIDDIALQSGTPRKSPDKLIPGRGDSANSPPCASPSPSIAIPSAANAGGTPTLEPGKEEVFAPDKRRRQGQCHFCYFRRLLWVEACQGWEVREKRSSRTYMFPNDGLNLARSHYLRPCLSSCLVNPRTCITNSWTSLGLAIILKSRTHSVGFATAARVKAVSHLWKKQFECRSDGKILLKTLIFL